MAVDRALVELWSRADGHSLRELLDQAARQGDDVTETRALLACLAEAGLLLREPALPTPPAPAHREGPLVSVILIGFNSLVHLAPCLEALAAQSYSPIEIHFEDNDSQDGSLGWMRATHPEVHATGCPRRMGLAEAINFAVTETRGVYLLLLNPDVRLDPFAVSEMVAVAEREPRCAAAAAKLRLAWAPAFLNGIGNSVSAAGWGSDSGLGHLDLGQFDHWREIPSACFAAALISRQAWQAAGPLDEGFPLYYEDSEWCYRARLLGWSILAAPRALGWHAFGAQPPTGMLSRMSPEKLGHVTYGRLRFAAKLLGRRGRARFITAYAAEDMLGAARALAGGHLGEVRARIAAWRRFLNDQQAIRHVRQRLHRERAVAEDRLLSRPKFIPPPRVWRGMPELTSDLMLKDYLPHIKACRQPALPEWWGNSDRPHLLLVSPDVVGSTMAGPGLRYANLALTLQSEADVVLAAPTGSESPSAHVPLVLYAEDDTHDLRRAAEQAEVVLLTAPSLARFPFLAPSRVRLVGDLYDPFFVENLHLYQEQPAGDQEALHRQAMGVAASLLRRGDFFICGSERQRDFWLGMLSSEGRLSPRTTAADPTLRGLIDVVGMGVSPRAPRASRVLRGVHPAFGNDNPIVLWGGGLWDWLDPLTLVRAWPRVLAQRPLGRLVFLGARHPNPRVPVPRMAEQVRRAAQETGELERSIYFLDWLPREAYEGLLLEANVGAVLHPQHLETHLALRTRVFDFIWARLPVLISDGDVMSDLVRAHRVGEVVPGGDDAATAEALLRLFDRPRADCAHDFDALHAGLQWERVVAPLRRYVAEGRPAPDRDVSGRASGGGVSLLRARLARGRFILRTEGLASLVHRAARHLRWRLSR